MYNIKNKIDFSDTVKYLDIVYLCIAIYYIYYMQSH